MLDAEEQLDMSTCFLALSHRQIHSPLGSWIERGVLSAGYRLLTRETSSTAPGTTIQESIFSSIASSDCLVADISEPNPNVFFELGLAQAMGKGILLISEDSAVRNAPFDWREYRVLTYDRTSEKSHASLAKEIDVSLTDFRTSPTLRPRVGSNLSSTPFHIEWDRLGPRDTENVCRELISSLGFRRLEWAKTAPGIDLVAELPRKDPDGYEFRELWLISMGIQGPPEMFLFDEPEFFIERLFRYSDSGPDGLENMYDQLVTVLVMFPDKDSRSDHIQMLQERMSHRHKRKMRGWNLRLRIWDQEYLTSLVQKFPSIGFKYFSEEGRIRSQTRKSYEDLYSETQLLNERLTLTNRKLEEEKNRRVRAERDAIWKDISFAAAHKIGNPIYAIENNLDPLKLRVMEIRTAEAVEVVDEIRDSVEKAKAIVEQFKSLAKAQNIKPARTRLKPLLEDACRDANRQGAKCNITCDKEIEVEADPDRLTECFEELVANAMHWCTENEKRIEISVTQPAPAPIPEFLDSAKKYLLIRFKDNGPGVLQESKSRIFDAFYTEREHGTGLGLALVRRIIDGHHGGIIEIGLPGKGANFEVFLPVEFDKSGKRPKRNVKQERGGEEQNATDTDS